MCGVFFLMFGGWPFFCVLVTLWNIPEIGFFGLNRFVLGSHRFFWINSCRGFFFFDHIGFLDRHSLHSVFPPWKKAARQAARHATRRALATRRAALPHGTHGAHGAARHNMVPHGAARRCPHGTASARRRTAPHGAAHTAHSAARRCPHGT